MTLLRGLARRLGYDLVPIRKAKALPRQLDLVLANGRITVVLDVGANRGQYASSLRAWGYRGRIVSFEPLRGAHADLQQRAAGDPQWTIAPRMALGRAEGQIEIQVSAESDMSSVLPQSAVLQQVSPTSRVVAREQVPQDRLDRAAAPFIRPDDRIFLKVDTQGYEAAVLDGAAGLLPHLAGVQLELPLVPCYEGEVDFKAMLDRMTSCGFEPHLFLPGYFERKLARQLQVDVVFMRPAS